MATFLNRGKKAKESANRKNIRVDFDKVRYKLGNGDSARVRILSPEDYVEYVAHGSFSNNIYSTACVAHQGERCVMCEAHGAKNEQFSDLYGKTRFIFAFYDLDLKMIRAFDASKKQANSLIDTIDSYQDELDELAFVFKRTGEESETTYTLQPITPKKMVDVQEAFHEADGMVVENEFFDVVIPKKPVEMQLEILEKAGFPLEEIGESPSLSSSDSEESGGADTMLEDEMLELAGMFDDEDSEQKEAI